jgi:hypothetical protein
MKTSLRYLGVALIASALTAGALVSLGGASTGAKSNRYNVALNDWLSFKSLDLLCTYSPGINIRDRSLDSLQCYRESQPQLIDAKNVHISKTHIVVIAKWKDGVIGTYRRNP